MGNVVFHQDIPSQTSLRHPDGLIATQYVYDETGEMRIPSQLTKTRNAYIKGTGGRRNSDIQDVLLIGINR